MLKLFIFVRSDLTSMTPGKACAQVAHAASQAARRLHDDQAYQAWEAAALSDRKPTSVYDKHTHESFGTTIVLNAGSGEQMDQLFFEKLEHYTTGCKGMIVDPGYPVRDGEVTHLIELPTCVWLFIDDSEPAVKKLMKNYQLY